MARLELGNVIGCGSEGKPAIATWLGRWLGSLGLHQPLSGLSQQSLLSLRDLVPYITKRYDVPGVGMRPSLKEQILCSDIFRGDRD